MENNKPELDDLINEVKDYLETRRKLGKLKAIDKGSQIAASSVTVLFLVVISSLVLIFISIAGALALSDALGKNYAGFLLVSLFYLLLGIILYIKRDSWIRDPIVNTLIQNFFKDSKHEDK